MGPDQDRTRDPWICSQTRICSQIRYRLRYAARRTSEMFWHVVKGISFKDISIFSSGGSHFVQPNHSCKLGRGYNEDHFCEIVLNWTSGSGGIIMWFKGISYLEL